MRIYFKTLTKEENSQFRREFKVLAVTSIAYAVIMVLLSILFSLHEVASFGGVIYFGIMFLVGNKFGDRFE